MLAIWTRTPVGQSVEPGLRKTASGWQAFLRRDGEFLSRHYARDVDIATPRLWREKQIGRRMADVEPLPKTGRTFAQDVRVYLEVISGLVTYQNRVGWLTRWMDALGRDRPRADISSEEIRRVLERWRRSGLSPATLNLRLITLRHLWTTLDGRSSLNIVKDIDLYPVTFSGWALPSWDQALKAVNAVTGQRERDRLRLFLWTGWPPSQMKLIRPERVNWKTLEVKMPGRKKGRGTPDVTLPILPQAATMLREYIRHKSWMDPWHNSTLGRALEAGCKAVGIPPFRPYWLRHIFGTMVATIVKDDRAVSELLQHRTTQMTRRYTVNSVQPRVKAAVQLVRKRLR